MQGHGQSEPLERGRTGPQVYARRAGAAGRRLKPLLASVLPALLPSACAVCGAVQRDVVCAACARSLLAARRRCPRCAAPAGGQCCAGVPDDPLDATVTLGDYADPLDQLVLRLKFGAALPVAGWLGGQLADRLRALGELPDLIAPVPLSPQRLAARGFNQAWQIARPLARRLGVRADATLLARRRDTAAQSTLDLPARQANLRDAFMPGRPLRLDGLHIGLVDDVMTTGATLRAVAAVLKAQGARRVTALPALRTP